MYEYKSEHKATKLKTKAPLKHARLEVDSVYSFSIFFHSEKGFVNTFIHAKSVIKFKSINLSNSLDL